VCERIGGFRRLIATLCLALLAGLPSAARAADELAWVGPVEAIRIAVDAYLYGYPLVTFDMVRKQQTNVARPDGEHAPMGQLIKMRTYPAVDNHCCAAPNADTLYTIAWLDVSKQPWIVGIPDMGDRYYIVPMLDGYSNVFKVASPPTTGSKAQTYAVTGPGWSGTLPEGVIEVKSPTGMVWMLGRIYSSGTLEDYRAVHALQDRFSVVPLASWGKPYVPPAGKVDRSVDMKTAVRKQVGNLGIADYFATLARLMKTNPPTAADAPMVARMAEIGLVPGQDFNPGKLGLLDAETLKTVQKLAMLEIGLRLKRLNTNNGWLYFTSGVGDFGTDYGLRAMANALGPGWNRPQDAVYPLSEKDANGNTYNGAANRYVLHFDKDKLPPVQAFWSLTMYDSGFFFVPNPINRYELSQRNRFVTNADGSVDLYVQAASPGPGKEANWLPAPRRKFELVLRLYWPTTTPPSILDGSWKPPPVTPVQ